jgi:energy-coupling factor transporter transmembrane protein EcfT
MLLIAACLAVPLDSTGGIAAIVFAAVSWCVLAGMPGIWIVRTVCASIVLFFPMLLLTPWMTAEPSSPAPMIARVGHAGAIALRSTCCLFVAASTITSLPLHDVRRGFVNIPLPRALTVLIVQIIMQTMLLSGETGRVIAALRLRAASGVRSVRALFSFPIVWMVRILFRAERTSAAMTVRGYGIETATAGENVKLTIADMLAIICTATVLAASVLMRLRILS